jgi:hypothetical protein
MAELIIGHTTHESTTIWVRGDERQRRARIALKSEAGGAPVQPETLTLPAADDFTAAKTFTGLRSETRYTVSAHFARTRWGLEHGRGVSQRQGRVRTFPKSDSNSSFSFLHGSCNLSNVRMTHTAGLVAAALGLLAGLLSLQRLAGTPDWRGSHRIRTAFRLALSWIYSKLHRCLFKRVFKATRFELPKPGISNPFHGLHELVTKKEDPPRFTIHAGDQIYFDIPFPNLAPSHDEYRRTYRQTWFEDPKLRQFLAECPHYMILDDHDIVDGFANDRPMPHGRDPRDYLTPAIRAYREYVNSRQPEQHGRALFYHFQHGAVPFFVLDTRTERWVGKEQMIGPPQMAELKRWLLAHQKKLKFVVSSVAFVAELRPPDERRRSTSNGEPPADPWADDRIDKWCGRPFRAQREEILEFAFSKGIEPLVFLVGDMHCTYHATMRVGWPGRGLTVHELAGGPAYQLQFASRGDFYDQCRGTIRDGNRSIPYTTSLRRVHGAASSVLQITAWPSEASRRVDWKVVSTAEKVPAVEKPSRRSPLSGRISF